MRRRAWRRAAPATCWPAASRRCWRRGWRPSRRPAAAPGSRARRRAGARARLVAEDLITLLPNAHANWLASTPGVLIIAVGFTMFPVPPPGETEACPTLPLEIRPARPRAAARHQPLARHGGAGGGRRGGDHRRADARLPRRPRRRGLGPQPGGQAGAGLSGAGCGGAGRLPPHPGRLRCDEAAMRTAIDRVQKAADPAERASAKTRLRRALEPPRLRLLTQFTAIPDGMKFLVDLRAELLQVMGGDALLRRWRPTCKGLLASWFDVGFLELRRIDWNSPGGAAREAGALRGGAPHPHLARPEEPARQRPPLLRLLPSAHAGGAADLRRGGAGQGHAGQRAAPAGREGAGARPGGRRIPRSSIRSTTASAGWTASASAIS